MGGEARGRGDCKPHTIMFFSFILLLFAISAAVMYTHIKICFEYMDTKHTHRYVHIVYHKIDLKSNRYLGWLMLWILFSLLLLL